MASWKAGTFKRKSSNLTSTNAPEETTIKRKRHNSPECDSAKKTTLIDDLPPEMLEILLQKVPTSDLLKCRQMNRKFNEIASRIIRQRADIKLHFSFENDEKFMQKIQKRHCEELLVNICTPYSIFTSKSLTDLVVCLKESKHFPITSFRFDNLDKFENEDMKSFLSIWGTNILSLNITLNEPNNNVGILRDLLAEKVPSLKILEINFNYVESPSSVELFSDSNEFQLPKLQVLCVNIRYSVFHGLIIGNILKAACNLIDFHYSIEEKYDIVQRCVEHNITTDDLAMLQSFNKLHCLRNLQIDLSEDLIDFWSKSTKKIDLKLESLAVSLQSSIWKNIQMKSIATAIINQLLHSSKDVMQTLRIKPLGSLPGLKIPKLEKLRKLDLFGFSKSESKIIDMFPPLFEMADHFPNLKNLVVHNHSDTIFFPKSQPLKPMPSIEIIRIIGDVSAECRDSLMKATSNVTTLLIQEITMRSNDHDHINFQSIANYLPKLQSFGWLICRMTHHELLHSLDAAITGLPVEFCKKKSYQFRNKDCISAGELAVYQLQQRNPSILSLKELKQLDVNFLFDGDIYADMEYASGCDCENSECDDECERFVEKDDEAGFDPDSIFHKTGFTKVSKFLAFDLMPNLKVRTHRFLD